MPPHDSPRRCAHLRGFLSLALITCGPIVCAEPWRQFRGPHGTGIAILEDPPLEFSIPSDLRWRAAIPAGVSSPVVRDDGAVVVTGEREGRLETLCLDAAKGQVLWRQAVVPTHPHKVHPFTTQTAPSPATDGTNVFVFFGSCGLLAYDQEGQEIWRMAVPALTNRHGFSSSPVHHSGLVYQSVECELGRSHLVALHAETGKLAWRKDRPLSGSGWSTPAVWKTARGTELVLLGRKRLDAYNALTGELLWWLTDLPDDPVTLPVPAGDRLLLSITGYGSQDEDGRIATWTEAIAYDSNRDGLLQQVEVPPTLGWKGRAEFPEGTPENFFPVRDDYAWLDVNKDGALSEAEWRDGIEGFLKSAPKNRILLIRAGATGDATDHVAWSGTKGVSELPSPLVHLDRAYTLRDGGVLTRFDLSTGRILDQERVGAGGHYLASPILLSSSRGIHLLAISGRGILTVVRTGPSGLVVERQVNLGSSVGATPAVDVPRGRILIRTETQLLAFGRPSVPRAAVDSPLP